MTSVCILQVRAGRGEQERKMALEEILSSHGQEDWNMFMAAIQQQETNMKAMSSTWDGQSYILTYQHGYFIMAIPLIFVVNLVTNHYNKLFNIQQVI